MRYSWKVSLEISRFSEMYSDGPAACNDSWLSTFSTIDKSVVSSVISFDSFTTSDEISTTAVLLELRSRRSLVFLNLFGWISLSSILDLFFVIHQSHQKMEYQHNWLVFLNGILSGAMFFVVYFDWFCGFWDLWHFQFLHMCISN